MLVYYLLVLQVIKKMFEARPDFHSFVVKFSLSLFVQGLANFSLDSSSPKVGQNMPGFSLLKFILLGCNGCFHPASEDSFTAQEKFFSFKLWLFFSSI